MDLILAGFLVAVKWMPFTLANEGLL